ncbi:MAG: M15 family metallopeptidase [Oscillospiraceae bacterium]|nr:M15 family metallopeptidase [Oscillospiraceae bacterium]
MKGKYILKTHKGIINISVVVLLITALLLSKAFPHNILIKASAEQIKKGCILGGDEPTIFDAIEILKYLVDMDGAIKQEGVINSESMDAAIISREGVEAGEPTIFCFIEILKYLIGMENDIGVNKSIKPKKPNLPDLKEEEWAIKLINAKNPLPRGYTPDLASIGSYNNDNRELDRRAAPYYLQMYTAARNNGINLVPVSSYRRLVRQEENFIEMFNDLVQKGYARHEAFDLTMREIAVPRTSEHNAGLAIDFNLIEERFDKTIEFRWLMNNAAKFGFILRYKKDTTHITGVSYEPWHFRFVGVHNAERINSLGITLEEYVDECANDTSAVDEFRRRLVG